MKKAISVLIAVIIACSACLPAFSQGSCDCGKDPIIYVYGFGRTDFTYGKGTDEETKVFFPEIKLIVNALLKNGVKLIGSLVFGFEDCFGHTLAATLEDVFSKIKCDENGDSIYEITTTENVVTSEHGDNISYFYYDWRADVAQTADLLSDYIDATLEQTGHEQVSLCAESMGGAVLLSYLYEHGSGKASSIIFSSSAAMGLTFISEMFIGNLDIKANMLLGYLSPLIDGFLSEEAMNALTLLDKMGVVGGLLAPLAGSINNSGDILYNEFLIEYFGRFAGFWAFVKSDYYEQAKQFMGIEPGSEFERKIDYYQNKVKPAAKDILTDAIDDGVKVAILSNYGLIAPPFCTESGYNSDALVDTASTSMGALCAPLGETLGEEISGKYVSPDRVVDASTALLPDNTWFVKYGYHAVISMDFLKWVAFTDGPVDIEANPDYPQFMCKVDGGYEPLTIENSDNRNEFVKRLDSLLAGEHCRQKQS